MRHVLAIDQGTTATKCLVVRSDGAVVGRGQRDITQYFPRPGWVEHDPEELFATVVAAAREAVSQAGRTPDAIGITNQRETVVVWERASSRPAARAIVWQDRRTAERCRELDPWVPLLRARTGLVADPYFSATKLEWLLRSGLDERAGRGELLAGTVDSWIIWRLTGGAVHATDPTNASRTLLYDIDRRAWSGELCELFGVPVDMLPEVRPSAGDFGQTTAEIFGRPIPIAGVAGDQQAALYGQGCWRRGEGKQTYGTGAFLLLNTGDDRPADAPGVLTTLACDCDGMPVYALEGAIFVAGAAIQWLRDGLGVLETAAESEGLAAGIADTGGVYFVPALAGLGAPDWEPRARGTVVGLTRGTGRAELVRAALEAMAHGTRDVVELMERCSGARFDRLRVDGGASANDWLMQFQADLLDRPVERPAIVETTSLGAAGLAGVATGIWPNAVSFGERREFTTFAPGEGAAAAQAGVAEWRRAVRAALSWARDAAAPAAG
ncbi:MAG: glycerol kinase GlpK [Gemmatimonadaceae bacterium]